MNGYAYLGLGSNIGERVGYLHAAIRALDQDEQVTVVKQSSIYETDPVGYENQALFLNMVIQIKTNLQPEELLELCLRIESTLGRKRKIRWGPRVIDIDVLLYDERMINTEKLTVPHPRICERGFVMIPLLELDPNIILPTMKQPLRLSEQKQNNHKGVRKWKQTNGEDGYVHFES